MCYHLIISPEFVSSSERGVGGINFLVCCIESLLWYASCMWQKTVKIQIVQLMQIITSDMIS